jgi:hypothetical protein
MKPGDWWPCFWPPTTDEEARRRAAKKLSVPEKRIEIRRTGGAVLTRERQEELE